MFTYNKKVMGLIPHVAFEILFFRVCTLSDVTVMRWQWALGDVVVSSRWAKLNKLI